MIPGQLHQCCPPYLDSESCDQFAIQSLVGTKKISNRSLTTYFCHKMTPTRIGGASGLPEDENSSVQTGHPASPTKISAGDQTSAAVPTIISSSPKPTAIPSGIDKERASALPVTTPSIMPGTKRERIPVDKENLKKRHGVKDSIIDAAMKIVEAINQNNLTHRDALLWGQPLQAEYQTLVSEGLSLAQSETITITNGHLNRILVVMGLIELDKIFKVGGTIARLFRKATEAIDTPEEFDGALRELGQLSKLLGEKIDDLITLRSKLEQNSIQIDRVGDEIEISLIAAQIFADFFNKISQTDTAVCLEERIASLTATLGQIRSSGPMRKMQIEQPMNLTTLIQNTVFNTLTSWMTSATALRMALHGRQKPNPTEVSEISRILQTIQQTLRKK